MKHFALTTLLFTLTASAAMAQVTPATVSIVLPSVELAVEKNTDKSDSGCAPAGVKIYDSVALKVGFVRNSDSILKDLMQQTSAQATALESDSSRCGSRCQQVNLVSTMEASVPNSLGEIGSCTSQSPNVIQKDFANGDDLQSYVSQTLAAKNIDGKQLDAHCPPPCSYHVASSITPRANNGEHLSLSVLCGPPRSGSILFAKYFFTAGLIQQWSCKAK